MSQNFIKIAVLVLGGAGLWILLVSGVKPEEMIVGAICTSLTVWFIWYVARKCGMQINFRWIDLLDIRYIPIYIVTGTWEIIRVLALDILRIRPAASLFRAAPFETAHRGATGAGRRVLAVIYTTAAPNFIVFGIDPKTHWLLFHQVKESEVLTMTRRLGTKA